MGEKIELIFGYAEHTPGQIAVRFKLDGQEFKSLRDAGTAEGSHAALVLGTNARNSGFYWTERKVDPSDGVKTPVNLFMTDRRRGTYPQQARQLVDRFRDQGFDVTPTGGYLGGVVRTSPEITAMDADEFYGHLHAEVMYVDARNKERATRKEAAAARLSVAALLEGHQEALATSKNVFKLRVAHFRNDPFDTLCRSIDETGETLQEPGEREPSSALTVR